MDHRRVLVTGSSGLLGGQVVRELADHGYDVVAVDRRDPVDGLPADVRRLDLLEREEVDAAAAGCSAAVHLAAIPSPLSDPPEVVFRNNTGATFTVLEAAASAGAAKVVLASSVSALGMTYAARYTSPAYVPIDEAHPVVPQDPYALSKWVDEQTGATLHRRAGVPVIALRFHWITTLEAAARRAAEVERDPRTGAEELWGYVDIRDAARACRLALEAEGLGFEVVNVVAADSLSSVATAELVRRFHPQTAIRAQLQDAAGAWSIDRARVLLGFEPRFSWRGDRIPAEHGDIAS